MRSVTYAGEERIAKLKEIQDHIAQVEAAMAPFLEYLKGLVRKRELERLREFQEWESRGSVITHTRVKKTRMVPAKIDDPMPRYGSFFDKLSWFFRQASKEIPPDEMVEEAYYEDVIESNPKPSYYDDMDSYEAKYNLDYKTKFTGALSDIWKSQFYTEIGGFSFYVGVRGDVNEKAVYAYSKSLHRLRNLVEILSEEGAVTLTEDDLEIIRDAKDSFRTSLANGDFEV